MTGGTKVLSDRIVVRITAKPGETFLDRMIALVEGASRQKTPNEIALNLLLAALTLVFLLAVVTLQPFAVYSGQAQPIDRAGRPAGLPDPDDHRRPAVRDRHRRHGPAVQRNVLAMSGRAVEAAGDVDILLLDKTGTITLGNRQAAEFVPVAGRRRGGRSPSAAQLSSLADETPEGRSIVVLAKEQYGIRGAPRGAARARGVRPVHRADPHERRRPRCRRPGTAQIRKGAASAVVQWVRDNGGHAHRRGRADRRRDQRLRRHAPRGRRAAATSAARVLGVVHLKDVVKEGMRERFAELRRMGIRTVMITGDNPLTARAIAEEAGRRRLPGRGDARGQDGADPARAGGRAAGRDDR